MRRSYPLFFLMISLLFAAGLPAQKKDFRSFKKAQMDLDIGIGLFPTFLKDRATVELPPVTVGAQYWFSPNFTLGAQFGHSTAAFSKTSDQLPLSAEIRNYRSRYYFAGLRFGVHCTKFKYWDLYGGMTLSYNRTHITRTNGGFGEYEAIHGIHPDNDHLTYYGYVGARYSCCSKISFWGEIGYGVSLLQLGVGYQLL